MIRNLLFITLIASVAGCAVAPATEDVPAFVPALSARVDELIAAGEFETADAEVLRLSELEPERPKWPRDLRRGLTMRPN